MKHLWCNQTSKTRAITPGPVAACVLATLVLAASLLGGCAEEKRGIDLTSVPMPEGGSVLTLAVLDGPDRLDVIAPSRAGFFVHRNDSGAWQHLDPRWPSQLPQSQSAPLRALASAGESLDFPPAEVFTAFGGHLWMMTGVPGSNSARLLVSSDAGRTWKLVGLPKKPEAKADKADPADPPKKGDKTSAPSPKPVAVASTKGARAAAASATTPAARAAMSTRYATTGHVRLLNWGELGLFLIDNTHLWQLQAETGKPLGDDPWAPVSLDGVDRDDNKHDAPLPQVLRHYLPANPTRPFELLTVLTDDLQVYRRRKDQKTWKPVAELPAADRQLAPVPHTDTVLMLTPEGLLRSENAAKTWTPISLPGLAQTNPQGVALQVLGPADDAPAAVLVALASGGIYRSVDLGEHWDEVRPPDTDGRVVTQFAYSAHRNRVWAATRGSGVLRSLDRGQTWHQINDELRATRAFDIGVDDNGGFLLGSDAGLFRLVGPAHGGRWQMLQSRATTAIHVDKNSGAILNGTASGAIVRLEPDGKTTTAEAAPIGEADEIAYQPMRFRGVNVPPGAIVEIDARPDSSQVFAWSAQQGPLMSLDGGVSWTRLSLNPAFRSALEGSYLSNFTTDFDKRMYLVTHSINAKAPTQLWRSYNNGQTWHAVSSFTHSARRDGVYVARSAQYPPEVLFRAHQDRFAKSLDGGNSWRDIPGPWTQGRILNYQLDGRTHLLIVDTHHAVNLLKVHETDEEKPSIRSYDLKPSAALRSSHDTIGRLAIQDGTVFLTTPTGLLAGALPDGQQKMPDGLAIIVTIASIFVLTLIGFGFLRWKG